MAKRYARHIGDDQLVYGLPKRMVGSVSLSSTPRSKIVANDTEGIEFWTVHPKATACDRCQAMAGINYSGKPERPHPNCRCEMKRHVSKEDATNESDCSYLVEVTLPGLGTTLLDQDFAKRVSDWQVMNANFDINLTFASGFRTTKRQGQLELDSEAEQSAPAGTSLHEAGRIVDANVSPWKRKGVLQLIVENAAAVGISWGGRYSTPAIPHFYREVPGGRGNRTTYIKRAQQCAKRARK